MVWEIEGVRGRGSETVETACNVDYEIFTNFLANRKTATRFDPTMILGTPVKNSIIFTKVEVVLIVRFESSLVSDEKKHADKCTVSVVHCMLV